MSSPTAAHPKPADAASPTYTWAAVAFAALASVGGIYLFVVEKKVPCPLCYYQRAFALGTLGLLLAGLLGGFNQRISVAALALPVAFAGLAVALFHVNLERTEVLECPRGMLGISTAPTQSAVLFGLLCAALIIDAYQPGRHGSSVGHVAGGSAAGVVAGLICCFINPEPPPAPSAPYESKEPPTCRRPYVAKSD